MPSQFSSVGFRVRTGEDLAALATEVADKAERVSTEPGEYLKWAPPSGEQLWLQVTPDGNAMGMTAHFAGLSTIRVAVEARITRPGHTPLEGAFLAWANPPEGTTTGGDYPFAFDCPDAATHLDLALPAILTAQVAAFAQRIAVYASPAAHASQSADGGASQSFIPSGLISPSGEPVIPPESSALIAGHVIEASPRVNAVSGLPYWWALVATVGGTFDVVIDPELLADCPRAGQVISGWFWLSGRLTTSSSRVTRPATGWFGRLIGRA